MRCEMIESLPAPNVTAVDRVSWNTDDVTKENEIHRNGYARLLRSNGDKMGVEWASYSVRFL